MKEMKVIYKNVDDLIPYENNPRKNDDAVEYVANSIKEFGFKIPIIIDSENVIVAGHTRLKASELLGLKEVPCIIADDLTEDQLKAFRIADNKVAEFSTWDLGKLELEFEDIEIDMTEFGFDDINGNEPDEIERTDLSDKFETTNAIEVKCETEEQTQELYDELVERGFECKVI